MMKICISALLTALAVPAIAEQARHADSHVHGVGELNIAIDGKTLGMELRAPGADIVGFEYAAKTPEDRAAVDAAVAVLARPLDLFVMPQDAECTVVQASAKLEHDDMDMDHKDTADAHDHDHDHDHAEDQHAEASGHSELHAEYVLTCGNPDALGEITFAYFDAFPNAQELEVQVLTASGARAFDVERKSPKLDLRGMF